jgi:hypothetical protein
MKALVFNGKVVEINNPFPVHPSMGWVDLQEGVEVGDLYQDGQFIKPETEGE